jgi:hypothetical protein
MFAAQMLPIIHRIRSTYGRHRLNGAETEQGIIPAYQGIGFPCNGPETLNGLTDVLCLSYVVSRDRCLEVFETSARRPASHGLRRQLIDRNQSPKGLLGEGNGRASWGYLFLLYVHCVEPV